MTFVPRVLRAGDLALRSAADSGRKVTPEAKKRFKEATQVLIRYSDIWHPSREYVTKPVFFSSKNRVTDGYPLQWLPVFPRRNSGKNKIARPSHDDT